MKLPRAELKKARIEIIPMIDAIFFLLVFFMMTSLSMVQLGAHKVDLPQSRTAKGKPDEKSRIVVTISKEGKLYLGQNQIADGDLLPRLATRIKASPGATVVINCDRTQHVGQFVSVFDRIKQANAGTVMIATTPRDAAQLPK